MQSAFGGFFNTGKRGNEENGSTGARSQKYVPLF